nr:reverse transcriptase domain-containing protein [Tanacetum cinerariifolium]
MNDLLRACPHHGFFELHQLDTFYNAQNVNDQDSLNSAAGGYFLDKMPRECLKIMESKSKVRQSRAKVVVAKVSTSSSTPTVSSEVFEFKDMVRALLLDKKNQSSAPAQSSTPASVKAVEPNCNTCGGAHSYQICPATSGNVYRDNIQDVKDCKPKIANLTDMLSKFMSSNTASSSGSGTLPSNTITNPKEDLKGTEVTKDQVQTPSSQSIAPVQPLVIQSETQTLVSEPVVASVSVSMPNLKPSIPYPSRRDNERCRLSLPKLTSTCMTLELADRSVSKPIGIAKDVSVKIGVFHFPADFVVVDFEPDPRVPLILGMCDLKTSRALIDVHKDTTASGNPTPNDDPIVSIMSPTLTLFGDNDFLLFEEADAFLSIEDDPNSPKINPFYYDPKGDILLL